MEDEAEMDDGGDDPDNEDEEEDQMAEVESEIEALLEIPVLLCGKNRLIVDKITRTISSRRGLPCSKCRRP
jgi:hypothetical protein